jgi:Spy/CpxP family protein refolding chaperone
MKRPFLTLAIILLLFAAANAQERYSIKDRVQQLKDSLSLSDSQAVAIDSILTSAMNKVKDISATGQERRQAIRQIMLDANSDIEKVLTDSQKEKFEQIQAERRNVMRERRDNSGQQ